jgi:hypothetical protein
MMCIINQRDEKSTAAVEVNGKFVKWLCEDDRASLARDSCKEYCRNWSYGRKGAW